VKLPPPFDHDAWLTAVGTGLSYGLVLAVVFLALFVVPFLVLLAVGAA
jgi:dolichyl-phosphate-mannose--protein O-mannosyl transferase